MGDRESPPPRRVPGRSASGRRAPIDLGVVPLQFPEQAPRGSQLPLELTSFVGREDALVAVANRLTSARLLTLTGPPGVGKTRLALRVAAQEQDEWSDGVWLVELADLTDPSQVAKSVASALALQERPGVPMLATLATALEPRWLLIVLDNCEHLLGGVSRMVEALLRQCPHLHILATSREPLGVAGEVVWPVPPLTLPSPAAVDAADAGRAEAVALFVARAAAVRPSFALTAETVAAVTQICTRLDGIPLALELAAARVHALTPAEIASRLDDRFHLLTAGRRTALPRQQTLQAAVDWSYALLSDVEQTLLRRVAVFGGGWTLAGAEGVCSDDDLPAEVILGGITALVARSLVMADERGGATRYRLLETLREYGLARLAEAGEAARLRARHYAWYTAWAAAGAPNCFGGAAQVAWLWAVEAEWANLREAMAWSRNADADPEASLRLVGALGAAWQTNGRYQEGREWLDAALVRTSARNLDRVWVLLAAAYVRGQQGEMAASRALLEDARELARALENAECLALAESMLGITMAQMGDIGGLGLCDAAHARAHQPALRRVASFLAHNRGVVALVVEGDLARATSCFEEALALERAADERSLACTSLALLGFARVAQGEPATARRLLLESLDLAQAVPYTLASFIVPLGLAWVAMATGEAERAAQLCGIAEAVTASNGLRGVLGGEQQFAQLTAGARAALGEPSFEAARGTGRTLPWAEALRLMRADPLAEAIAATVGGSGGTRLSPREREVTALIVAGRSNREIAAALRITRRTAATHVEHILNKLGLQRRAQIAAWASAQRLHAAPPASTPD